MHWGFWTKAQMKEEQQQRKFTKLMVNSKFNGCSLCRSAENKCSFSKQYASGELFVTTLEQQ